MIHYCSVIFFTFLRIMQPAPITQLSPIVTPFNMTTFDAIQQCYPILTGADVYPCPFIGIVVSLYLSQLSPSIVCFSCYTSDCASPRWFLCTTDFHFDKRCRSHAQGPVDGLGLLRRTAARPELHLLAEGVDGLRGHWLLRLHADKSKKSFDGRLLVPK